MTRPGDPGNDGPRDPSPAHPPHGIPPVRRPTASEIVLGKATPDTVREALRPIHDPELMISIVDLGLIYGIEVPEDGSRVTVRMTLTSPACPIGPELMAAVDHTVKLLPGVGEAKVELVWDPPWDPTKMASEAAREQLGIW
jgi:metal-sulfur cluster biosynthetic enzyme